MGAIRADVAKVGRPWTVETFSPEVLRVDTTRIEALAEDEVALAGVSVDIVGPGEPVRITHVLDAVEPRHRSDGRAAFPTEAGRERA